MEAYCVKCKEKREITEAQAIFTSKGTPATRGVCPVCGTKIFRMGRTVAHEGLTPPDPALRQPKRSGKLVIVESPAKARTVKRFLGKDYTVKASIGHVRDLLRSQLSVDVENDFKPKYRVPNEKRPIVKELKEAAKNAAEVYLATDPDREGEAIAWHLIESADINPKITQRVVFHEITEPAVAEAFAHTRDIDTRLVDAQQARRVLDRLVGYNLSPLLWRKVRGRLSAGRVQSVALRLIAEREREIDAFVPEEYWTIAAELRPEGQRQTFIAKLARIDNAEPELKSEAGVRPVLDDMQKAAYHISKIKKGQRRRNPLAPFITSSLQQEASRRLGYTARRTMALAQQLYEGIDIGQGGAVGLITYMRTDSTNVSELAQEEARGFIQERYGVKFLPDEPPKYKTRARGAQEAHEAIRPTSVLRQPEALKEYLSRDLFRLYQLVWQRFVASQMAAAIYDTLSVEVSGKTLEHLYLLRAAGSTIVFQGFLIVYEETRDEDAKPEEEDETARIPPGLAEGQLQHLVQLLPEQHFTQPPPRYTEATLVRTLEENGIGRPSTYAPILSTIQQRGYVTRDGKRLFPTETGLLVNDLLIEHFPEVLNVGFTASMEADLDRVASGQLEWVSLVRDFYSPFARQVELAEQRIPQLNMGPEPIGRQCPECGHELVIRWGRYGKFISCSNFPECRYTEAWLEKIGVKCPKDGGDLVERKTRKGRIFYGCANYPECDFTSWKRPLPKPCPECNGLLVIASKKEAQCIQCEQRFSLDDVSADEMAESTAAA
ncbi:MAG: type I DNA topoisomerase [Anaerolineales bacterium]|nr:type I DNA topoisomerase [Anaerolineales bacterium]